MALYCTNNKSSWLSRSNRSVSVTVSMAVVATVVSVAIGTAVSETVAVVAVVSIGLGVSAPLAVVESLGGLGHEGGGMAAVVGNTETVAVATAVSVGKTMSIAVVGIGISAPLAVVVSGAVGDGSEGAAGETGGVMVARESGVDVVVVDSDSVAVVSVGVSAPLAVAVGQVAVRTGTVDCALDSVPM